MSLLGNERRLFSPQTEAVCDSQPPQAPGGGGAASEQTGERLQHQPDAALFKKPALLQPQHQGTKPPASIFRTSPDLKSN